MALTKSKESVLHLLKIRFDKEKSNVLLEMIDENKELRTLHVSAQALEVGKWYVLSMGLDFMGGNAGVYLVWDRGPSPARHLYMGVNSKLGSVLPDTNVGRHFLYEL